jgi:hypothetical protein
MTKARPSKEYTRFNKLVGELLTVPKSALNERLAAHKEKVAATPQHKKRGPKPRVTPPVDVPEPDAETAS